MTPEIKAIYDALSDDEKEAIFILAQRKEAERKGHKLCVCRCNEMLKRLCREAAPRPS